MKLLKCKICNGEADFADNDRSVNREVKCRKCGHASSKSENKGPEVVIIRKRPFLAD